MSDLQRIVVGLSGGVDSAVSAWLLKQQGHEVLGVFMKNWEDDDDSGYCASHIDFIDAAAVADVIGIDIEHVNFANDYKERVFAEFLREHQAGRTPNPDVLCNAEIKFKAFLDHALNRGAQCIATGHYARVRRVQDAAGLRYELLKGLDAAKDQSYFLHRLNQAQLARTRFPVGELRKTQVRQLAADLGLPNARKKDSTGICFIGERPFREFLQRYLNNQPGPMLDDAGRLLGQHVGLSFYTLGQRQGLGIGGTSAGGGRHAPWYVARKELTSNTLRAVQGHDHPWLWASGLMADSLSWVAGQAPQDSSEHSLPSSAMHSAAPQGMPGCVLGGKTRYRQPDAACRASVRADGQLQLRFDAAQWAITPGQSAVLYDGEVCLGGGLIVAAS